MGLTSDGTATYTDIDNVVYQPLITPAYTLLDAMLGYQFGKYNLSLQAKNITDITVITSCAVQLVAICGISAD